MFFVDLYNNISAYNIIISCEHLIEIYAYHGDHILVQGWGESGAILVSIWDWSYSVLQYRQDRPSLLDLLAVRFRINLWRMVVRKRDRANECMCLRPWVIPGIPVSPGMTHSDSLCHGYGRYAPTTTGEFCYCIIWKCLCPMASSNQVHVQRRERNNGMQHNNAFPIPDYFRISMFQQVADQWNIEKNTLILNKTTGPLHLQLDAVGGDLALQTLRSTFWRCTPSLEFWSTLTKPWSSRTFCRIIMIETSIKCQ